MEAWKLGLVVLAALCVSCQGASPLEKRLSSAEKIGSLRRLMMVTARGGSDWMRLTSPLLDVEMNPDGSGHVKVGDGSVARFETDSSGNWKGRIGSDGSVMEGEGNVDGESSVTVGGGSVASIKTEGDGSAKAVVGSGDNATVAEVGANGDVKVKGPSVDVEIDGDEDGEVDPAGQGAEKEDAQNSDKDGEKPPQVTGHGGHDPSHMTIVDHVPGGTVGWLSDAFIQATQDPPIVSTNPPIGKTPAQVAQGISSGNGVNAPDTYYSNAHQALQQAGVTDLPDSGNAYQPPPTTPLTLQGAVPGEGSVATFG